MEACLFYIRFQLHCVATGPELLWYKYKYKHLQYPCSNSYMVPFFLFSFHFPFFFRLFSSGGRSRALRSPGPWRECGGISDGSPKTVSASRQACAGGARGRGMSGFIVCFWLRKMPHGQFSVEAVSTVSIKDGVRGSRFGGTQLYQLQAKGRNHCTIIKHRLLKWPPPPYPCE